MNKLKGKIINIISSKHLMQIELEVVSNLLKSKDLLSCVIINNAEEKNFIQKDNLVYLIFKETEVAIGVPIKGQSKCNISMRNQLQGKILDVEKGKVLSKIVFDYMGYKISSLITTSSTKKLQLKKEMTILGLIKSNEISLMPVENIDN